MIKHIQSEVLFPVLFIVDKTGMIKDVQYTTLNLNYEICPELIIKVLRIITLHIQQYRALRSDYDPKMIDHL
jgi:hypothetical protein